MKIQPQSDTFARRIASMRLGADWHDGPHHSQAQTLDGQSLKVRYPWEENPHFEWQHYHDQGRPAAGIADSLDEAKAQAEQSHKNLSGQWDPDAEQEALDPRLLGAARFARQYFALSDGLDVPLDSGEKKNSEDPSVTVSGGGTTSTPFGLNDGKMPNLPPPSAPTGQHVNVGPMAGGGMPSGGGGGGAPVSYSPGAGSKQWEHQVELGLQRNGLPLSLAPQVEHQIDTESSGNPNAINNTDSNAQAGHPSQGLLQTIPGTFNQYHLPGDSTSITDPQANIDSAIGYAKSTYGPTLMNNGGGMGSGHGY